QCQSNGTADSAGCARDDSSPSFQLQIHLFHSGANSGSWGCYPFGEPVVRGSCDGQSHNPRQVDPTHRARNQSFVERRVDEGDLHQNPQYIAADSCRVDSTVDAAVAPEEGIDVVVAMTQEVVIDKIDRGPRYQHIQQQENEILVVDHECILAQ